jgi:hypothetical protein
MSGNQFAIAALAASFGGAVGAIGMALLSWSQIQASIDQVRREVDALGRSAETQNLRNALDKLWRDFGSFGAALARLKEMLRIR